MTDPRVGLIYTPWRPSTFKLLYGQAFPAPNAYELYLFDERFGHPGSAELTQDVIEQDGAVFG